MEIPVATADALIEALAQAAAGVTILLESREYTVDVPLDVPDGVTVQGAGVMEPEHGLPDGFQHGTETTIKAGSGFKGNLVTLHNGSSLGGLVLHGAIQTVEEEAGCVVAVASRGPQDIVSATIVECKLINNTKAGAAKDGPTGGAILVCTGNPNRGAEPPPHVGAQVTLALTRSIVATPRAGKAVFAMNFASGGQVAVNLTTNRVGGPLDVVGGLARPDPVDHAMTTVNSKGNNYSPPQQGSDAAGWQIIGGSSPPFPSTTPDPNTNADSNTADANSTGDQITDFQDGIVAVGGRRIFGNLGTCSNNTVKVTLTGTTVATNPRAADAADFEFVGAQSGGPFPAGDNNKVIVEVLAETTSDPLFHIDVHGAASLRGTDWFSRAHLPRHNLPTG